MNTLNQLWGTLPLLALVALVRLRIAQGERGPDALLQASVWYGAGVWVLSNGLGAFGLLKPEPLQVTWLGLGAVAAFVVWKTRRARGCWPMPRGLLEWSLAMGCTALLLVTLARALLSPPNTVDVLNYHLPRQLMWLQQGSLDPFVTVNDRQNMMPPLAEVIGLQFLALTGDDYWANLVQWAAYLGSGVGLASLVRRLSSNRMAAGVAALLGLLIPMAYHEASNAKNDLLSAFWLLAAAVQLAAWREREGSPSRGQLGLLGATLALAWLTKSTAMLFIPSLLLCGSWSWWRSGPVKEKTMGLALVGLVALVLIAPFHARNFAWYGNPLGEHRAEDGGDQVVGAMGPRLLASNVLRAASLHVLSPSESANARVIQGVGVVHRWLRVDVEDRRTTLWTIAFDINYQPDYESVAGAPLHFVVGFPALLLIIFGVAGANPRSRWLAAATLLGALSFCLLLKWQPWAARLHLPLFMLGTAAGVAGFAGGGRHRAAGAGAAVAVAWLAWLPGADTVGRTLWREPTIQALPREVNYYRLLTRMALREPRLLELIHQAQVKHLLINSVHDVPYPLMRSLRRSGSDVRFFGAPASRVREAAPDALLVMAMGLSPSLYADYGGRDDWRLVGEGFGGGFYLPSARVVELGWQKRLPDFGGWSRQAGLAMGDYTFPNSEGVQVVHEWREPAALIAYESKGRSLHLLGQIRFTEPVPSDWNASIEFLVNGEHFAWARTEDAKAFQIALPSSRGPHVVEMRRMPGGPEFVFTQLVVTDEP